MKQLFLLLLSSFLLSPSFAQVPAVAWQKTFGGSLIDHLYSIKQTPDNGFIFCGYTTSEVSGDKTVPLAAAGSDFWIIKTDFFGVIEWQKSIGASQGQGSPKIILTSDGGYLVGCDSNSDISGDKTEDSYGGYDFWVVKLDTEGDIQWDRTLGGNQDDRYPVALQTPDGGYLIGGRSKSNQTGVKSENCVGCVGLQIGVDDMWLVRLDASGQIVWQNTIGGSAYDDITAIVNTPDGGFLVGGSSYSDISGDKTENSRGGMGDMWLVKLNATGTILWQRTIGGSLGDGLQVILHTDDNGFLIGGPSNSNISGEKTENAFANDSNDVWILKLNNNGDILWQKTIGGIGNDYIKDMAMDIHGAFLLGTYSDSPISFNKTENPRGGIDFWVVKVSSVGSVMWDKTFGGEQNEGVYSVSYCTTDDSFIFGGPSLSSDTGDKTDPSRGLNDYWIIKLEPENLSKTSFDKTAIQIYPNPTSRTVNVALAKKYKQIKIAVTDISGRSVIEKTSCDTANVAVDIDSEKGIYFMTVENESGEKLTFKVAKK